MGHAMRCRTCEALIDVLDECEECNRYKVEKPLPTLRGQKRSISDIKGVCIRGHAMRWAEVRWRCRQCECLYAQRKRLKRKVDT